MSGSNSDIKKRVAEIFEQARRDLYRPPNPDRVTPEAYAKCVEFAISPAQLIDYLMSQGVDISDACRMVLGPPPHEGRTWQECAKELRERGWTYQEIADYLQGWYGSQSYSTVQRFFNAEAAEKQREYDAAYKVRNREAIAVRERERYHKRKEKNESNQT